jgi:hypothetical protein
MKIRKNGAKYLVKSSSSSRVYDVNPDQEHPFCTCPQFIFRGVKTGEACKHIIAVREYDKSGIKKDKTDTHKIVGFVKEKGKVESVKLIEKFGEEAVNSLIKEGVLVEKRGMISLLD